MIDLIVNQGSLRHALTKILVVAAMLCIGQVEAACVSAQSCQQPSQEQAEKLFSMIVQLYPATFSGTPATQVYSANDSSGFYRVYADGAASLGVYQGSMWYSLGKGWQRYSSLDEANAQFCAGVCFGVPQESTAFRGNVVLGSPTDAAVKVNLFSADQSGSAYVVLGNKSGSYDRRSANAAIKAGVGSELQLSGLAADTQYFYRLYYQDEKSGERGISAEYSFHTQRARGTTFMFALQGDSHPERERSQFDATLYNRTLQKVASDKPDFYLLMGDDFSVDTLDPLKVTRDQVTARYTLQRPYLAQVARNAPLFLVNGNHEQAARYLLDGTPNNVAVWAQTARNNLYSQPAPDGFYSGNSEVVPFIGNLRNYFAWEWGDALFVVIDFYWGSDVCVDNCFYGGAKRSNQWDITLGTAQYAWLKQTLEQSTARHKFVFAHHVLGTGRGGVENAGSFEWGGFNGDGRTNGFALNRPALSAPIHKLFVDTNVKIFFQGHDHIWVRQALDGVTYQTVSEPADPNYSLFNDTAFESGVKLPNTGYTRVTVSPVGVRVDYVRTWLPKDEVGGHSNGEIAYTYVIP
jgi:phosphodiesterase/alkaline phosphatase D-like protein